MNKKSFLGKPLLSKVSLLTLFALFVSILMPQSVWGQSSLRDGTKGEIQFTTKKAAGDILYGKFKATGDLEVEGATIVTYSWGVSAVTLLQSNVTIKGDISEFGLTESEITDISFSNCANLEKVVLSGNSISSINFAESPKISTIYLESNKLKAVSMDNFITSLPNRSGESFKGKLLIFNERNGANEGNLCTASQVKKANEKGWNVFKFNRNGVEEPYQGEGALTKHKVTVTPAPDGGRYYIKGTDNTQTEFELEEGTVCEVGVDERQGWELATLTYNGTDIKETKRFTVTGPGTLAGTFKKLRFPVTLVSNEHGTISIQGYDEEALKSVEYGTTLTVVPKANDQNCVLTSLKVKGREILPEYSFVVRSAVTVEAFFTRGGGPSPIDEEQIILTTSRQPGQKITLWIVCNEVPVIEGATGEFKTGKDVEYTLTSSIVKIKGVIQGFRCKNGNLVGLDVTKAKNLRLLFCQENELSRLDVSKNTRLEDLSCSLNQLTSLNVSNNPELKNLYCYNNDIQTLDLTANSKLERLHCYTNNMETLKLGEAPAMKRLWCFDNKLNQISLSKMTVLESLWVWKNQFKGASMDAFMQELPNSTADKKELLLVDLKRGQEFETNYCTESQVNVAKSKGWAVYDYNGDYNEKKEFQGFVAVEGLQLNKEMVYYNAADQSIVVGGVTANANIVVNTLEGSTVLSATTDQEGNASLDASSLHQGVYILSVGAKTFKVLVY